ncbi:SCO3242 family prenyltransferase [Streptomyces sp. NPDC054841]
MTGRRRRSALGAVGALALLGLLRGTAAHLSPAHPDPTPRRGARSTAPRRAEAHGEPTRAEAGSDHGLTERPRTVPGPAEARTAAPTPTPGTAAADGDPGTARGAVPGATAGRGLAGCAAEPTGDPTAVEPPGAVGPRASEACRGRLKAWAELLRVSALFTVPGDALAGAASVGLRANRGTALAIGSSLCLYEAGMALNDWADRDEDAVDRPHRPIPSGRISPAAALAAAGALTAAGLALAARAGRPALLVASVLTATVWSYDLRLKHTPVGPAAMASARALDLLLGATATHPTGLARALPHAGLLGAHTYAITSVSRHEVQGGSTKAPLAALATALTLATLTARVRTPGQPAPRSARVTTPLPPSIHGRTPLPPRIHGGTPLPPRTGERNLPRRPTPSQGPGGSPPVAELLAALATTTYARTTVTPFLHAALNPSPPLTQRAVGAGIRAMIPLQAALAARAGAAGTGLAVLALIPVARRLARKVSPT